MSDKQNVYAKQTVIIVIALLIGFFGNQLLSMSNVILKVEQNESTLKDTVKTVQQVKEDVIGMKKDIDYIKKAVDALLKKNGIAIL